MLLKKRINEFCWDSYPGNLDGYPKNAVPCQWRCPFIFQPSPSLKVDSAEIQMIGGCGLFVAITSTMNCKKQQGQHLASGLGRFTFINRLQSYDFKQRLGKG